MTSTSVQKLEHLGLRWSRSSRILGGQNPIPSHRELLLTLGASEDQLAAMESEEQQHVDELAKQLKRWHG